MCNLKNISFLKSKSYFGLLSIILFLVIYLFVSYSLVFLCTDKDNDMASHKVNLQLEDIPVIIIDAGHGGVDGGAVSESGILEKDINLKIAGYLRDLFLLSDIRCVLTRENDEMLTPKYTGSSNKKRADLIARTEIANETENSVFVSIHQNKFQSSKYHGLQVFYSKNNSQSKELAEIIKFQNNKLVDNSNNRETKPAGREIYILDNLDIPAVLIECGFLSNAAEAERLNSDSYQKQLALMIYSSLMTYIFSANNV